MVENGQINLICNEGQNFISYPSLRSLGCLFSMGGLKRVPLKMCSLVQLNLNGCFAGSFCEACQRQSRWSASLLCDLVTDFGVICTGPHGAVIQRPPATSHVIEV